MHRQAPREFIRPVPLLIIRHGKPQIQSISTGQAIVIELRQKHNRGAEPSELLRGHGTLAIHKNVKHSHKRSPLPRIILQVKHLEAPEARCAEGILEIGLEALRTELPRSLGKNTVHPLHTCIGKPFPENFKIIWIQHPGIFPYFGKIWITLELAILVAYHRHRTGCHSLGIIPGSTWAGSVEDSSVIGIGKCECGPGVHGEPFTPADPASHKIILPFLRAVPAEIVVGAETIQVPPVFRTHPLHPFPHKGSVPVKFISERHHDK